MDPIDRELKSRHEFDAALLRPDPAAVVKANPPRKARWTLWAHGAAGLLAGDKNRAGVWLQACSDLLSSGEHQSDQLWVAEVFSALSELSLLDGEYYDALARSQSVCQLWRVIETSLSTRTAKTGSSKSDKVSVGAKEYIDGKVSELMEKQAGGLRDPVREMVLERALGQFLFALKIALRANEYARQYNPGLLQVAREFMNEHAQMITQESRYEIFIAFGNQASAAGAVKESLEWFDRAVNLYYQNCRDENDLSRLVQALFNKAGALARLEEYDEALQIYRMIQGDFERVGNYEAELRIDYAILHTRYKKGERQELEGELRKLMAEYQRLFKHAADEHRPIDKRNFEVVKSLLLTLIVSKPHSAEVFLEAVTLTNRGSTEQSNEVVLRYQERQRGGFTHWRDISPVELSDAHLACRPDTTMLMFESGVDCLLVFVLQGGTTPLANRCRCATLGPEFTSAFVALLRATDEENTRILQHRTAPRGPVAEDISGAGGEIWQHLPQEVRAIIQSSKRLLVVLSPFGNLSEFPVDLILSEEGWLGLTHAISNANSLESLIALLADNGTPRQLSSTALVVRAGDPEGMAPLEHSQDEAEDVVRYAEALGLAAKAEQAPDPEHLIEDLAAGPHLFHYVGHGSANALGEKLLLSADRWLPSPWLRRIPAHRAPIAFLSACEMGRARLAADNEKGFVLEMLNSGAPGVIAATRPVSDSVSGDIVREIYSASRNANCVMDAIQEARRSLHAGRMNPVCWSAYIFFGRPEASLKPGARQGGKLQWHQLLMHFLASGAEIHKTQCLEEVRRVGKEDKTLASVEALLVENRVGDQEADRTTSALAGSDLLAALRLRSYVAVVRVQAAIDAKKFDQQDSLLSEMGIALSIALRTHDSFALVGAARRHCKMLGIIALNEITRVLSYALTLAGAMAVHDQVFQLTLDELKAESQMYQNNVVMDLTNVLPRRMFAD